MAKLSVIKFVNHSPIDISNAEEVAIWHEEPRLIRIYHGERWHVWLDAKENGKFGHRYLFGDLNKQALIRWLDRKIGEIGIGTILESDIPKKAWEELLFEVQGGYEVA
jgi:hypothetical protein